jgi:FlaA1/EpsC-like NDP-sugar epimerase
MRFVKNFLSKSYAPRWLILQIDLVFCFLSVVLAYLLRFNFNIERPEFSGLPAAIGSFLLLRLITFYFSKTYHGVVRYTSTEDAKRIFIALTFGSIGYALFNFLWIYEKGIEFVPWSIVVFEYFSTALMMSSFRLFIKIVYAEMKTLDVERQNVIIYGAGESGLITKRTVDQDRDSRLKVIAFLDDDPKKREKTLEGLKIYHIDQDFDFILSKHKVDELIISIQDLNRKRKEEIVDLCLKHKIAVKTVPPASDWINGEFSAKQFKNIRIEDLLERDPIELDQEEISGQLNDKVVLITGACGSIGSELVRQVIKFYPKLVLLVDQSETPLYELQLELKEKNNYVDFKVAIADIRNYSRMDEIISTYRPQIIYHAAAYKHVPLMEENPSEAVATNVGGTRNLADLAVKYEVNKFVFISTDKAVNPTNVMGASKRIAEIYVQSLNGNLEHKGQNHTKFITTRFGNVLGSNGSVIPRFRKQLESGGPITVTHPEISRFFMTIPEACQLILEAGMMGRGGEIYVFDMGDSVKIVDLARKMISLSGFKVGKDIQIVYTGLRPGEKIMEELLNNKEKTLPTHHPKIMIGKVREYPFSLITKEIAEILDMTTNEDDSKIVGKMKSIVPEFLSNNSIYEALDKMPFSSELNLNN